MKEFIETQVKGLIQDIRLIAEDLGASEGASLDEVSKYIWEEGDTGDIADAAHSGGQLAMLEIITKAYTIKVSENTQELFKWQNVIDPA